jgi:hypothetical protein
MLSAGLKFETAITAANMLQSDNRGADLAQGRHELRDDRGIESIFLPDSSKWNLYRLWRQQVSENNMSGQQFFIGSLTTATPKPAATRARAPAAPSASLTMRGVNPDYWQTFCANRRKRGTSDLGR